MARYETTVTSPESREVVYEYLADFSSAAEWDPGVRAARVRSGEPGRPGSEFEVVSRFLGRDVPLVYRTVLAERPSRVLLMAESGTVVSRDEITLSEIAEGGTAVTYTADLRLRGPLRVLDPVLRLVFRRIGDSARDGLAARLAEPLRPAAPPREARAS